MHRKARSRFSKRPPQRPWLKAALVVAGAAVGARLLVRLVRAWFDLRARSHAMPHLEVPPTEPEEVDRWLNEGGSTADEEALPKGDHP